MAKLKWIVLRETLSGGRIDGRQWPPAGEMIDVPAWEAEHAVNAGWAYYAEEPTAPEPPSVPQPVKAPARPADKAPEPVKQEKHPDPAEKSQDRAAQNPPDKSGEPDAGKDAGRDAGKDTPVKASEPEPPRPSDPKQDWVDYAAGRGMSEDKAQAMSKADLMSRYGGRL